MSYKTILPKQFHREVDNSITDYSKAALQSMKENRNWLLSMTNRKSKLSVIYTEKVRNCSVVVIDNEAGEVVALYLNNNKVLECTK